MASEKTLPHEEDTQRKWFVLFAIGIGTFMSALDGSVVNTILPIINQEFGSDIATIEWVVVVYLLVVSGLLLSFGRLGDLQGHKKVYISGFAIFIVSSALCGLAPDVPALVGFRALQAMGGAVLMANSPAILTRNFPARQRGQALGLQATMTYLGLTVGPSLGGWLAHQWSWRSVFYINIPVGLVALWLSYVFIPRDSEERQREKFDFTGAFTFIAGLVALLLGLNKGHDWGWTSPAILALLAGAAVLLGTFVILQRRISHPMLDLSLFRQRIFSTAVASATLNYISIYSLIFLMPFYLIQGRGLNTAQAGLLLTAQPLVMALAAPLSGTVSDRIGSRVPATLGMLILAAGLALLSRLGPQTPLGYVAAGLAISGLGTGIFISPNTSALMGSAPRHRQGIAAGMLATSRSVGMVLGVGMAGAILTTLMDGSSTATLYTAIDAGFIAAAIAALASGLISATRGKEAKSISPQANPEMH